MGGAGGQRKQSRGPCAVFGGAEHGEGDGGRGRRACCHLRSAPASPGASERSPRGTEGRCLGTERSRPGRCGSDRQREPRVQRKVHRGRRQDRGKKEEEACGARGGGPVSPHGRPGAVAGELGDSTSSSGPQGPRAADEKWVSGAGAAGDRLVPARGGGALIRAGSGATGSEWVWGGAAPSTTT